MRKSSTTQGRKDWVIGKTQKRKINCIIIGPLITNPDFSDWGITAIEISTGSLIEISTLCKQQDSSET